MRLNRRIVPLKPAPENMPAQLQSEAQRLADAKLGLLLAKGILDGKGASWHYSETALVRALSVTALYLEEVLKQNGIVL